MIDETSGLKNKVAQLNQILTNTKTYRQSWNDHYRNMILTELERLSKEVGLDVEIELKDQIQNLEAIVLSLGNERSGIAEIVDEEVKKPFIRQNGMLIYQQIFNGKILVMIQYPYIEGYGDPRPPKNIAIYRPEEIKEPFILRHMEEFIKEVATWEDYDDDDTAVSNKIGFNIDYSTDSNPD